MATTQTRVQRSLAPPHVGETLGAVLLGASILAIALLVLGISVVAGGLTAGSRFADPPPPNVDEIGRLQVIGGLAVMLLAGAELGLVAAIVADRRWARPAAAALNGVLALLASLAALTALTSGPDPDGVIALALGAVAAWFTLTAAVIVIQRRAHLAGRADARSGELSGD